MPAGEAAPEEVYGLLAGELALDGTARRNLATFCTTWSDDQVHRLMNDCLGKNMIDKDEYRRPPRSRRRWRGSSTVTSSTRAGE